MCIQLCVLFERLSYSVVLRTIFRWSGASIDANISNKINAFLYITTDI